MWIVIIIIIIVCYVYGIYNLFNSLDNKSNKLFLELDTYFQKRINLIPTLVNIFKQYNLEKDTIDRILFLTKEDYTKQIIKEKIMIAQIIVAIIVSPPLSARELPLLPNCHMR